jgi:hypothetical protein
MRLELFLFRYRDDLTGKWKRARYVAQRHVIAERFAEFEIIGPPRIRNVDPGARYFTSRNDATKSPTRSQPERLSGCISA